MKPEYLKNIRLLLEATGDLHIRVRWRRYPLTGDQANYLGKPSFWRTSLKIRVSGRKASQLAQQLFAEEREAGFETNWRRRPTVRDWLKMARILVIDDDPDMRALLEQTLKSAGHEVALAADGREGLEQYRAKPAGLVITDLYMPNQGGLETIMELRRRFPEVVIIAISGKPEAGTMLSIAQKLGAVEVLQKPFVADELLAAVGKALRIDSRLVWMETARWTAALDRRGQEESPWLKNKLNVNGRVQNGVTPHGWPHSLGKPSGTMKKVLYCRPDSQKTVPAFVLCENGELTLLFVAPSSDIRPDFILMAHDDDGNGIYEDAEANWFNVSSKQTLEIATNLKAIGSKAR
jgi:CheY-like chemotaxis protein